MLRNDVGTAATSANVYFTPAVVQRIGKGRELSDDYGAGTSEWEAKHAFETHWDWMDVVIVQVSGTKLWSVASQPAAYLSPSDRIRRRLERELSTYALTRYEDFLLRPGDALNIPRGLPHNASTVRPRRFCGARPNAPGGGVLSGPVPVPPRGPAQYKCAVVQPAFHCDCKQVRIRTISK
mmetsp:Transcript_5823/g.16801  ORF Transcript_5823/g.16801 Transcript_5823/m.16801 type:complete len:180 (-) Transcript_5823:376-915(-)